MTLIMSVMVPKNIKKINNARITVIVKILDWSTMMLHTSRE